jgi:hypothetical protein
MWSSVEKSGLEMHWRVICMKQALEDITTGPWTFSVLGEWDRPAKKIKKRQ